MLVLVLSSSNVYVIEYHVQEDIERLYEKKRLPFSVHITCSYVTHPLDC